MKENGHAFDSNIDGDPFNFRLGIPFVIFAYIMCKHLIYSYLLEMLTKFLYAGTGIVIEGWDIGIDGNSLWS